MIFNTFVYYALFLFPSAILFRVVPSALKGWVCALFGCFFFVYFATIQFSGWLGAACVFIFLWEATFRSLYRAKAKACIAGVLVSIGVLSVFKYWNFATDLLFLGRGSNSLHWDSAFLPLGVSFFTFEFIHYAVDRYRGKVEKGSASEYLAFIFFFPTMVAGPIKRFQDFVVCLRNPSTDWQLDWNRGITRILVGLAKKFAIADLLSSLSNHLNQEDINLADRWVLVVWLFAYGWKIYFDFSAYSDIAIGSGRLFGIKIPENFDWPYTRTDIASFWRHWHISLYKWLVDYIFIPLGGSRVAPWRISCNVMVVMLVSGLWHGAALNFLVWGAWHGMLLVVHRWWISLQSRDVQVPHSFAYRTMSWLLTYTMVNLGWAFFAMDLETAALFFKKLLVG